MKQNKSAITTLVILAILVVGYVIWLSYANQKVREVVDSSLARIEERMEANGNDVTIAYDDVKVHGLTLRPRASLYKLHVKIVDRRAREVHLSFPEVVYTPKTFSMRSYQLEVLDSVTMITHDGGEQETTLVDFSSAPTLHVDRNGNDDWHYVADIPTHITLTEVGEDGDMAAAPKTDIAFASKPQVEWAVAANGISLGQKTSIPQTTVSFAGQVMAEAEGLLVETRHTAQEDGLHRYATVAKLDNLTFAAKELEVLNPINIMNDVTYTGPVTPAGAELVEGPQHFQLKNIAWMSGLMSIFANGEVWMVPEQKMPHGNISLRFDDIDAFFDYAKSQRPRTEKFLMKVRTALEQISGTTVEEGGSITIDLTREPNGRLYIGKLSLEEGLGLFIELMMQLPDFSAPQAVEPSMDDAETDFSTDEDLPVDEDADMDVSDSDAGTDAVDAVEDEETAPAQTDAVDSDAQNGSTVQTGSDEVSIEVMDEEASATDTAADAEEPTEMDAMDETDTQSDMESQPVPDAQPVEAAPAQ